MNNDHHILAAIFSNYPDFLGQKAASLRTLAAELAEQSSSGVYKTDQKWKVAPFLFRFFRKSCLSHPCLKLCATWMDSATVVKVGRHGCDKQNEKALAGFLPMPDVSAPADWSS